MKSFDVVVIGGGPGGLNAGLMLRQAGKSVAMIQETQDCFGGICLNRGCMPTKSFLKAARVYREAKEGQKYGLDVTVNPVDLKRLHAVVTEDVGKLQSMIQSWIDAAQIAVFRGRGSFLSDHDVLVSKADGSTEQVRGETIIIATGATPVAFPGAPFDGTTILSSDQILNNTELPQKLLIVGGGAIGCEFATLYNTLGSEVTMVEAMDTLMPREDPEVGQALQGAFEQQGIRVKTGETIDSLTVVDGKVQVRYGDGDSETVDKVLVGIGRTPNIDALNLPAAGIETQGGAVKVNESMQTSVPHVYALGDAIGGWMLAHAAEREGQLLAQNLIGGASLPLDERAVPRVAFCHPEMAAVGAHEAGGGIKAFTLAQVPNGRSVLDKVAPAFVKLFVVEATSEIAGVALIGEAATEMIHEMALAVENRLTLDQVRKTIHAHPTHSEGLFHAVQHFQ